MASAPPDSSREEAPVEEEDLVLNFGPSEPIHCWKKVSSCEEFVGTKRSKHTIVAWNDRIYVFGGDNGRRMLNDFLVSHIQDSSWARVVYTGKQSLSIPYMDSRVRIHCTVISDRLILQVRHRLLATTTPLLSS